MRPLARGRQAGPAMESATGGATCPRVGARTSQPRHAGGGAQIRRLFVGRRQKRPGLPNARAAGSANTKSCLRRKNFEPSGDRPAVPRQLGDWAEEFRLPMLLTVCIEAGRKTLTHASWTGLEPVSRKWMSGQAAALAAHNDPGRSLTQSSHLRFESPLFQAPGDLRLLLTLTYHGCQRIRRRPIPKTATVDDTQVSAQRTGANLGHQLSSSAT